MKKTIFCVSQSIAIATFILCSFFNLNAQSIAYLQPREHDANRPAQKEEKTLTSLLSKLEKKYKVSFSFDRTAIKDRTVTMGNQTFKSLEEELSFVLKPLDLLYEKLDDKIYLIFSKRVPEKHTNSSSFQTEDPLAAQAYAVSHTLFSVSGQQANPPIVIRGRVTSASGEALQQASIVLKGTATGTVTDRDGNYFLNVADGNGTLVFSQVGYVSKEVEINSRSSISISLEKDFQAIGEVVVVGYGTQKRKDLTGSIATISGADLNKQAVSSVDQALQGKLAGVLVTTNSGEPGGGLTVRVRGIGGFGNSDPLYVIDGVIITYSNTDASSNPLATLNMSDIESINVLKDASASAIYGARAGNGVVLITTKRGRSGKPRINAEAYYGIQKVTHKLGMMNAKEFAQFSNDSRTASGSPTFSDFANPESLGEGVNWQDVIYRTASMNNYQVSASGGSDKSQYYLSGGYQNQDGIIKGSAFDRYSLRINLDNQLLPWLKVGNSLTLSRTFNNSLTSVGNNDKYDGVVAIALRRSPTSKIYNPDGSWAGTSTQANPFLGQIPNPLRVATELNNPTERIRGLGNIYMDVKLARDLTFRTSLGIDYVLVNANGFQKLVNEESVSDLTRSAYSQKSTNSNLLSENTLNYKHAFGSKHNLDVLVGYTAQKSTYDFVSALSENHLNDVLTTVDAGSSINRLASGNKTVTSYLSYLGRINYAYDDKYLLTANIRRDGASVFSSENKFAVFPSFSLGYRLSREDFMSNIPLINNLMLRGSWGQTGIDGSLGVGAEYASMTTGYLYNFGGTPVNGMTASSIPNIFLKWETVTQTDFGFDLDLLNNHIHVTADYFSKRFTNMIEQRTIPAYFGIWDGPAATNTIKQATNGATVENKGLEFSLNYENQNASGDFSYNVGVNFTTFSNKVIKLIAPTVGGSSGANVTQGNLTRTEQGRSVGEFYGFLTDGIFQTQADIDNADAVASANTAPGDLRFVDVNGDHKITDDDKTYIGSPVPDFTYGIVGNVTYRQFDFNFAFQGVQGNQIVNVNKFITESSSGVENKSRTMLNRWTPENQSNIYPRAVFDDPNNNDRFSNRHVENGSFLRLRNVQLGYKLPMKVVNRISMSSLRVYISAQNPLTITKYSGYNPDIGSQKQSNASSGLDNTIYPQSTSIIGGIQIGF